MIIFKVIFTHERFKRGYRAKTSITLKYKNRNLTKLSVIIFKLVTWNNSSIHTNIVLIALTLINVRCTRTELIIKLMVLIRNEEFLIQFVFAHYFLPLAAWYLCRCFNYFITCNIHCCAQLFKTYNVQSLMSWNIGLGVD